MKNLIAVAILALALAGCDKVVSRTPVGEPYNTAGTQSCSKGAGMCYACGMGFDGYKCNWGFKYNCPGDQPVTNRVQNYAVKRESGEISTAQVSHVISVDGECH